MKIKASDFKPGMIVAHNAGKGILTVDSITIKFTDLLCQVKFYGIGVPVIYQLDDTVEVIGNEFDFI